MLKKDARFRLLGFLRQHSIRMGKTLQHKIGHDFLAPPRPDDIFIAAYPGSGLAVVQMMLYQLTTDGGLDFPHIESVAPAYDFNVFVAEILPDKAELFEALPSPRVFYTRDLYSERPRAGKFVYLVRNVRDVVVAMFHQNRLVHGVDSPFELHLDLFLAGEMPIGSWFEHTRSWWPHRHDKDVLFLIYDEVVADLEGTALRVAEFFQIDVGERLPRIVKHCSPDFLERHSEKFDPRLRRLSRTTADTFIRKGKSGSGRAAFNAQQEKLLNKKIRALTRQFSDLNDSPGSKLLRPE